MPELNHHNLILGLQTWKTCFFVRLSWSCLYMWKVRHLLKNLTTQSARQTQTFAFQQQYEPSILNNEVTDRLCKYDV